MSIYLIHILIKLKNASLIKKESINITFSIQSLRLLKLLYVTHVIQAFSFVKATNSLNVFFKFYLNKILFNQLRFISTPSQDVFLTFQNICRLQLQPKVSFLISTDFGYMSENTCKQIKKGGKVLFLY